MTGGLPVHPVDLSGWTGDDSDRAALASALHEACRDTGFLVLEGHGVPDAVIQRWVACCTEFFGLPVEEKRACRVAPKLVGNNIGYTELGEEAAAYTRSETSPPDLFEAITFSREDAVGPRFDQYREWFPTNVWPARPPGWSAAFREYDHHLRRVATTVLQAMGHALRLRDGWLAEQCADAVVSTRTIRYERAPGAPEPLPGQLRLGAHTDFGVLTLLWADDVPGLQVRKDGLWHDVTVRPGQLVANIGDLLARWTNDRWNSTLHRVLPPPSDVAGAVRRRSVAYFVDAYPGSVVEPIPSCVDAQNPARYDPVLVGDYLAGKASKQLVVTPTA